MKALYVRISTANQNYERQLKKDKSIKTFIDVCSGSVKFKDRKEGKRLLSSRNIDEVEVKHIDRLGRNLKDILETIDVFTSKGINIYIKDLGINTLVNGKQTSAGNLIIQIFGAVAELERNTINERTQQGREIAKSKGVYKGRKRGATSDIKSKNETLITWIQSKLDEGVSISKISEMSNDIKDIKKGGVSRATIYNYIKKGLINHSVKKYNENEYIEKFKERMEALEKLESNY